MTRHREAGVSERLRGALGALGRRWSPRIWRGAALLYWRHLARLPGVRPQPYGAFAKVGRSLRPPGDTATRVLFFSTRQERDHVSLTTMLAQALTIRGHAPVALHCDRLIPSACNTGVYPGLSDDRCERCYIFARDVRELSGVPTLWLSHFVGEQDWREARACVASIATQDLRGSVIEDLPVGELVRHSVAHFLRTDEIDQRPEAELVYRNWLVAAVVIGRAVRRILDEVRPRVVVSLSGYFMPESVMRRIAAQRDIRTVFYEAGARAGTYVFDHDRPIDYAFPRAWAGRAGRDLRPDQIERVQREIAGRRSGQTYLVNYWPTRIDGRDRVVRELGLETDRRTVVLFTNLTWDSAVYDHDVAFDGLEDWVVRTVRWFTRRFDAQLIVRVHPAEVILEGARRDPLRRRIERAVGALGQHVKVVDAESNISSYALIELSDLCLVYTSTVGLEAAAMGRRVIVAGDVHYRRLGFTDDPDSAAEYFSMIDRSLASPAPLDRAQLAMALRYAYFYFFEAPQQVRSIIHKGANDIPSLVMAGESDLRTGVDPALDRVCSAIVDGTPFIE